MKTFFVLLALALCPCFELGAQNSDLHDTSPAVTTSCYVSAVPYGARSSVIGDSDGNGDSTMWLVRDGGPTVNLKFLVKLPSGTSLAKHIQKFENISGGVSTPFNFPYWFPPMRGTATMSVKDDFGKCTYPVQLVSNGFESTNVPQNFGSSGATINSVVTASGIGTISSVEVSVQLNHTWDGDVTLTLIGPDATSVVIASGVGSGGDNYGIGFNHTQRTVFSASGSTNITAGTPPFTGIFIPQNALTPFNGKTGAAANGVWTLKVTDNFTPLDDGTLVNWALIIND